MVSPENEQATPADAAQQAAEVAVGLTEAEQLHDRRRLMIALNGVARSASRVLGQGKGIAQRGTGVAKRGGGVARRGAVAARHSAASGVSWLSTQVVAMGPRLAIRDQATLRAQFPGRSDEEIAAALIERAARAAGAVGGATGAWAALPVLPAFPAEVAAETLAVVGIEIKLVAELHEAYGVPATGTAAERARAYLAAWAHRRGLFMVPGGLLLVAGSPLARQLRRRLAARVRRSTFALSPLFTGALAGIMLNRRETRKLGHDILRDMRHRPIASAERVSGPQLTDPHN
jgi:hypothetical protein